ncbi:MAG: thymidylate synthase [Candidatus Thiodiazotropha lotti]|nr:thymidylate synthase [Candidatus Thiodiazotropha lotti]MCW4219775.1 thymidylate synthase [Candidatus Thiodiazotropha lotti]
MIVLSANTADGLWRQAAELLLSSEARQQDGRNGTTREVMRVAFELSDPKQRWITSRRPAINPAFAIAEVIWIINGRNDSAFLNYWNRQLPQFAGEGQIYYGAYGHRLRAHFDVDQLARAADALSSNLNGRQVVLQIWDVNSDLPLEKAKPRDADIPCNVMSVLKVRDGRLDWLQLSRSNDIFRGIPYNFIQFTYLQEILAGWIGIPIGVFTHISDSLHVYEADVQKISTITEGSQLKNEDAFSLSKDKSGNIWKELATRAEQFSMEQLSKDDHIALSQMDRWPKSFQSILSLLGAESARRRGWGRVSHELMDNCESVLVKHLWEAWYRRVAAC